MSAQPQTQSSPTKVVTGKARASYVYVFQPRTSQLSGKEEYSITLLIPKTDRETMGRMKSAMDTAKEAKWHGKEPPGMQLPIHDGDRDKPNGGSYGDECRGHWVLNVKTKDRPGVVDANNNKILDPTEFVSGDYCRVSLNAFAYDNARKGLSFGLNNIQVIAKGEPLSSRSRPEDDFADYVGDGKPAANDDFTW